ncbi:hypothetical protein HT746_10630 [Burkholderia pyrrocinia]|uniref:hypothetical protein n=1 Tax=Burkholderia pyrrocinia TaxID=60550 RepID=UPI0015753F9F|nr:hypothetical protein [Burkholderia pyrrocinia]NTX27578.1 hypothetical protein [Burkholderia pyrrocinia]
MPHGKVGNTFATERCAEGYRHIRCLTIVHKLIAASIRYFPLELAQMQSDAYLREAGIVRIEETYSRAAP